LWISEDQSFWDDIEEGPRPLGPLGLQQVWHWNCVHYSINNFLLVLDFWLLNKYLKHRYLIGHIFCKCSLESHKDQSNDLPHQRVFQTEKYFLNDKSFLI
jgi:hypothetical protein